MFVSQNWIRELIGDASVDFAALEGRFVLAVAEIEGVVRFGHGLTEVLVGEVVGVEPHPNADKLRLADVDLGPSRPAVRVVCGAPDLRLGMRVPFVPPGVTLPSGIEVRHGEVRGIPSPGMLASEADLGLSEDHDGLLELHGVTAHNGTALPDAIPGLEDVLFEIDNKSLTHRPDLWGHLGIAREIAALLDRPLALPPTDAAFTGPAPLAGGVAIDPGAADVCPRYLAARFSGVQVAPSPVAARLRLRALGVRPISNVVDATNLVMLETGNPLHAFDARFVRGEQIVVRRAAAGETIRTLDDAVRTLQADDLVIADGEGPVALAGIMGGGDSEIRDDTTTVVLESANFDGAQIRKTSARLGLRSESSARFEKSLDPDLPAFAAARFAATLAALCPGAAPCSTLVDVGRHAEAPAPLPQIHVGRDYLRQRLGLSDTLLPDAALDATLLRLGFRLQESAQGGLVVTVPRFRAGRDVGIADDLVEELGRHYGYDRIPSATVLAEAKPTPLPPARSLERRLRAVCAIGAALTEVELYSFEHEPTRERLGLQSRDGGGGELPRLRLRNTLSSEHVALRRGLCEGLLGAVERNLGHGTASVGPQKGLRVGLFEFGHGYLPERTPPQGADFGLPPVLVQGDSAARDAYLAGLGALAEDAAQAAANKRALPLEANRLGVAIGERLGGGADGGAAEAPPAALTASLWAEATAAVVAVFAALGLPAPLLRRQDRDAALYAATPASPGCPDDAPGWLHPARHAWVYLQAADGSGAVQRVGVCSMLHPQARAALEVPAEVALVELDTDALLAGAQGVRQKAGRPPRLPATSFDVSIPARADVAADVLRHRATLALQADPSLGALVEAVDVVATFRGESGAHPYAVSLRIRLRDESQTVRDADAQRARATIAEALLAWADGAAERPVAPDLRTRLGLGAAG